MLAETFTQLLRDPAHWFFELTVELVTGVFIGAWVWPWAQRRWHKRHDSNVHDIEPYVTLNDLSNIEDLNERVSEIEKALSSRR